jgi:phospholipid/cholesterol/gamma-HCH transport system permease protein
MASDVPWHRRPTETFPIPTRGLIRFFRRMSRARNVFGQVGRRAFYVGDIARGLSEPRTWFAEFIHQMRVIGVDSVPLTVLVAAFIGAVISLQTRYQLFAGVQLSVVGLATRQTIILEMGPLLTGLVLTGRVGARMTAEIGTMRVTEQIDALETLAYDPIAYLVVPRLLAALIMLPVLTIIADAVGIGTAMGTAVVATDVTSAAFAEGLRLSFTPFQIVYSIIKATIFGGAIAFFCSYEGYTANVGAEGVGRSTAQAVVVTSVAILVLDALTALLLAPYLQA